MKPNTQNRTNTDGTIRPMRADEVQLALQWAEREGWNPGIHDAQCFYAADPEGFFVAEVAGKPVGFISAVRYDETFAFMGLYIVLPEFRGHGYGLALWNTAMEYLGSRNVGLDGVVAQQNNYRKSEFVLAHRNVRYELTSDARNAAIGKTSDEVRADPAPSAGEMLDLKDMPFDALAEYDTECFRSERREFLKTWIEQPGAVSVGLMTDGKIQGCGVLRQCVVGFKIGPLFADSSLVARRILMELLRRCPAEGSIFLDVSQTNDDAVGMAEELGMAPMFETARMYTAGDPGLPMDRIFGITTFELG